MKNDALTVASLAGVADSQGASFPLPPGIGIDQPLHVRTHALNLVRTLLDNVLGAAALHRASRIVRGRETNKASLHHRLRGRPTAHPGLGAADLRAGAGRVGRRTDRRTRHARQARAGIEAATAARTHHPTAQGTAALRHADDRYRPATADHGPLNDEAPRLAGLLLKRRFVVVAPPLQLQ